MRSNNLFNVETTCPPECITDDSLRVPSENSHEPFPAPARPRVGTSPPPRRYPSDAWPPIRRSILLAALASPRANRGHSSLNWRRLILRARRSSSLFAATSGSPPPRNASWPPARRRLVDGPRAASRSAAASGLFRSAHRVRPERGIHAAARAILRPRRRRRQQFRDSGDPRADSFGAPRSRRR